MEKGKYYKRIIEESIQEKLETSGGVLIRGPKYCGKTTTARRFAKSEYALKTKNDISLAKLDPKLALSGLLPRLIDEWQKVPDIWNYVRSDIDDRNEFGLYILTGSTTPPDSSDIYHSGAGRIVKIDMSTLSLSETGESRKLVSVKNLFNGTQQSVADNNDGHSLDDVLFYMCRGGWPRSINAKRNKAVLVTRNYYDSLLEFDDSDNEEFRKLRPEVLEAIVRSYARNISTEASYKTISDNVTKSEKRSVTIDTFSKYLSALKDLFVFSDIEAWLPNLRSKTAIRSTSTRHFTDTSVAIAAIGLGPDGLKGDLNYLGLLFEDFAIHELRIYASSINAKVKHYRDKDGLECDAILEMRDGTVGLCEIKLGGVGLIREGVDSLKKLEKKLASPNRVSFKMIITAIGACAKMEEEGIWIVPINCLCE